jgi:hypothetical protein
MMINHGIWVYPVFQTNPHQWKKYALGARIYVGGGALPGENLSRLWLLRKFKS